jgi:hypothetical protein
MAKTKQTKRTPKHKTAGPPPTAAGFSGSPRRKHSELKLISKDVTTRGSRRINLVKMIDCHEGVQLIHLEIPGKRGVEGFGKDFILMVTDGNQVLSDLFITSVGERRSEDGTDVARKNHRGYWCRVVIRIAERPETLAEKRQVLDRVAAVSERLLFCDIQIKLLSSNLPCFDCVIYVMFTVVEHART